MSAPQTSPVQTARGAIGPAGITISDIDIPFGRLVMFFVKAALAAIPATIIVWFIMAFLAMIFSAIFGFGGGRGWMMM
jgi:hypothetical protein